WSCEEDRSAGVDAPRGSARLRIHDCLRSFLPVALGHSTHMGDRRCTRHELTAIHGPILPHSRFLEWLAASEALLRSPLARRALLLIPLPSNRSYRSRRR